jgi:hypothetical protein
MAQASAAGTRASAAGTSAAGTSAAGTSAAGTSASALSTDSIEMIDIVKSRHKYTLSRERKTKILDYLEKKCEGSGISKKTMGNTIRSYHVSTPFVVLILLFYGSQLTVTIAAMNLIFVFICFFLTNGCLLTMLEHRLCGDEFTIADPFIEYFGWESTSKNKVFVSYCIAISFFILFFLVYYIRFYWKKTPIANILS